MAKRIMKSEHFKELLQSVQQMGVYLKGRKSASLEANARPKMAAATRIREPKAS